MSKGDTAVQYSIIPEKKRVVALFKTASGKVFRGVAKCSDLDQFDEEVGKKIALLRMRKSFLIEKKATIKEEKSWVEGRLLYYTQGLAKYNKILSNTEKEITDIKETLKSI